MNPSPSSSERPVIRETGRRDTLIAVAVGLILLAFVGYGVMQMGSPVQGNKLSGAIVEKVFIPMKEKQVSFTGRRIEGVREVAGEFILKVRVPPDDRIYEVPVEEPVYLSKKVGDTLTFLRPPSEQK